MYNKRNFNENDVKLILNEVIIQIFINIIYKGFQKNMYVCIQIDFCIVVVRKVFSFCGGEL